MNDKTLADKVVAHGVVGPMEYIHKLDIHWPHPEHDTCDFVRDWRVYGALYMLRNPDADVRKMIEELANA